MYNPTNGLSDSPNLLSEFTGQIKLRRLEEEDKRIYIVLNRVLAKNKHLPKKTIYGRCPKCKTKSALEVVSGNPGKEKFRCNQCYSSFGMDDL